MNLKYIFTLKSTQGTTGFASCVPAAGISLETAIQLLGERPLDTFLHRHALKLLCDAPAEQWRQWADVARTRAMPHLAALLLELCLLEPEAGDALRLWMDDLTALAAPWEEHTPETLLVRSGQDHGWRENIHAHAPMPAILASDAELQVTRECLSGRQGLLAAQREALEGGVTETQDAAAFLNFIQEMLEKSGAVLGREMRHEASLSPIALLQSWRLDARVDRGRNAHTLSGDATAYGRGLKLVQARISCRMEIVERICAHAQVEESAPWGAINGVGLVRATWAELMAAGRPAVSPQALGAPVPAEDLPLHWLPAEEEGGEILVPAQAVFLFCNLDEITLFEHIGSTGLASAATLARARLHALEEILERYAHATTAFRPEACFELESDDPVIKGLLEDYRWRGIKVQFQDITPEWGIPVYRCFVQGRDGAIAQGTGCALNGARAAMAALTETPWPYVWATPLPAPSGPGLASLPRRQLETLPNFSLGNDAQDLRLLENTLRASNLRPVYATLRRPGISLPVCRAFIPMLEVDTELEGGPSRTLLARSKYFSKGHNCA